MQCFDPPFELGRVELVVLICQLLFLRRIEVRRSEQFPVGRLSRFVCLFHLCSVAFFRGEPHRRLEIVYIEPQVMIQIIEHRLVVLAFESLIPDMAAHHRPVLLLERSSCRFSGRAASV